MARPMLIDLNLEKRSHYSLMVKLDGWFLWPLDDFSSRICVPNIKRRCKF